MLNPGFCLQLSRGKSPWTGEQLDSGTLFDAKGSGDGKRESRENIPSSHHLPGSVHMCLYF
jgi:hypothetical protein